MYKKLENEINELKSLIQVIISSIFLTKNNKLVPRYIEQIKELKEKILFDKNNSKIELQSKMLYPLSIDSMKSIAFSLQNFQKKSLSNEIIESKVEGLSSNIENVKKYLYTLEKKINININSRPLSNIEDQRKLKEVIENFENLSGIVSRHRDEINELNEHTILKENLKENLKKLLNIKDIIEEEIKKINEDIESIKVKIHRNNLEICQFKKEIHKYLLEKEEEFDIFKNTINNKINCILIKLNNIDNLLQSFINSTENQFNIINEKLIEIDKFNKEILIIIDNLEKKILSIERNLLKQINFIYTSLNDTIENTEKNLNYKIDLNKKDINEIYKILNEKLLVLYNYNNKFNGETTFFNISEHSLILSDKIEAIDLSISSDIRLKTNIYPLINISEKLKKINPVSYTLKSNNKKDIGFIAQNIEPIFPELVNTNDKGIKSVKYQNFTAVLLAGFKEQQKQIDNQKKWNIGILLFSISAFIISII